MLRYMYAGAVAQQWTPDKLNMQQLMKDAVLNYRIMFGIHEGRCGECTLTGVKGRHMQTQSVVVQHKQKRCFARIAQAKKY